MIKIILATDLLYYTNITPIIHEEYSPTITEEISYSRKFIP